jgi:AraC-like DNA-binding protein
MMTIVLAGDGAVLNETDTMSRYRERPAANAADLVRCWWEQRIGSGAEDYVQRVLPDGCSDVIVTAAGDAFIAGPTMAAALPRLAPGARLRGLRIRTGALAVVLGLPGTELRDLTVPLAATMPDRGARSLAEAVWDQRIPESWPTGAVDGRVSYAARRLMGSPATDAATVAGEVGLTGRHLRRLLLQHAGLGCGSLQRVGRLQHFLRLADREWPATTLATLAAVAGYADQAHLSREIRELAGTTPRALLRERLGS